MHPLCVAHAHLHLELHLLESVRLLGGGGALEGQCLRAWGGCKIGTMLSMLRTLKHKVHPYIDKRAGRPQPPATQPAKHACPRLLHCMHLLGLLRVQQCSLGLSLAALGLILHLRQRGRGCGLLGSKGLVREGGGYGACTGVGMGVRAHQAMHSSLLQTQPPPAIQRGAMQPATRCRANPMRPTHSLWPTTDMHPSPRDQRPGASPHPPPQPALLPRRSPARRQPQSGRLQRRARPLPHAAAPPGRRPQWHMPGTGSWATSVDERLQRGFARRTGQELAPTLAHPAPSNTFEHYLPSYPPRALPAGGAGQPQAPSASSAGPLPLQPGQQPGPPAPAAPGPAPGEKGPKRRASGGD
jgi:hypothetical protein